MVSERSIKEATKRINDWEIRHPSATFYEKLLRGKQYAKELLETNVSLATLPSIFYLKPDYVVHKLKKRFRRR